MSVRPWIVLNRGHGTGSFVAVQLDGPLAACGLSFPSIADDWELIGFARF